MIDDFYDKFGETIQISAMGENMFHCTVTMQISKTFFEWIADSCGKVHILSPDTAISAFQDFIDRIKTSY